MGVSAQTLADVIPPDREDRGKPSITQKRAVDEFFAQRLSLDPLEVYTTGISKPGNVKVRATQSDRAQRARILVLIVEDAEIPNQLPGTLTAAAKLVGPGQRQAVVVVAESQGGAKDWSVHTVIERDGGPVVQALRSEWPDLKRFEPNPVRAGGPGPSLMVPLTMDESTERMARLAVASSPAVLFVGPPGTGKNRLLNEILTEIEADPSAYGFTKARETVIEPAEEGWTTRDLVGGETIDEKRNALRFRPGKVLDAIANDRWIVIDEANRADLDRIFGGLLTWLTRQQVVVGRASTAVGAPLVRLGWTDQPSSYAEGTHRLAEDDVGTEPIDYLAGTEFRLLGTYNALDAQRVFRFGLALGRRFAQVPVPPASVDDFEKMIEATSADIPYEDARARVKSRVTALYRAHHTTPNAQLGPALFLNIPDYVAKGLALAELVDVDPESDDDVDRLVLEGYLLSAGAWLARLDPDAELQDVGAYLTAASVGPNGEPAGAALDGSEWNWLTGQLPTIGG